MRTRVKTDVVYKFQELSESAQEKAIENFSDLNVDYEWWEFIYEDAENVGMKITGFDTGRGNDITGKLTDYPETVAQDIIKNHGESCDTYQTAKTYLDERAKIVESTPDDEDPDTEEIDEEFERALKEDYLSILRQEYEYQTSREVIVETIEANDYEFTENGKLA